MSFVCLSRERTNALLKSSSMNIYENNTFCENIHQLRRKEDLTVEKLFHYPSSRAVNTLMEGSFFFLLIQMLLLLLETSASIYFSLTETRRSFFSFFPLLVL